MRVLQLSRAMTVRHYRRTLALLTVVTTTLPLLLFILALRENIRSTQQFHDVARCAYLRGRCLLVYCQTQSNAASASQATIHTELSTMDAARSALRRDYPALIGRGDDNWSVYEGALRKVGQADWPSTLRVFQDYDRQVTEIRSQAYQQDRNTSIALLAAVIGMIVSTALAFATLRGLAAADARQTLLAGVLDGTSDTVSIVDAKFNVLYVNKAYRKLIGAGENEAISRERNMAHFSPETSRRIHAGPEPGEDGDDVWQIDGELVNQAGQQIPASLVLINLYAPDGKLMGFANVSRDMSQVKAAESELRYSRERLEQAQSLAQVGSWEYHFLTGELDWSNEMRRIAGYSPTAPLPTVEGFMDTVHPNDRELVRSSVARVESHGVGYDIEYRFVHQSGDVVFVRSKCEVMHDAAGRPESLVGATVDITDAKLAEQEYRRLASIVESTDQMIVAVTLDGVFISWNRGAERIYGYAASDVIGRHAAFLSPSKPEFVEEMAACVLRGELVENVEVVRTRKDGGVIDVSLNFSPVFDASGQIVAVAIMGRDITERKRAEQALRSSQEQLAAAQQAARLGSWAYNVVTGAINWSDELFHILGFDPAAGEPSLAEYSARYHPDDYPAHRERLARANQDGVGYTVDARLYTGQGELRWMQITAKPIQDEQGRVVEMIGTMLDITTRKLAEEKMRDYAVALEFKQAELERSNEQLARLATQDGLTHLKNHRAFQERLGEEIERAQRYDTPLSLMLIDVDHFKQYNDTFGHPEGDKVLKRVALMMEEAARHTDIVARYGGEEFVIVLPQTDAQGAAVVAERVRKSIESVPWQNRAVTVSVGVCSLRGDALDQSAIISEADAALYESKRAGRNRVTTRRTTPVLKAA